MDLLKTGSFFGLTNQTTRLDGLTLTDMVYTHEWVDWHYHENAYFTFLLAGQVLEGNKKETYRCTASSLLFHNWQDAHYNIKPKGYTRGFQVELDLNWFKKYDIDTCLMQGCLHLDHPKQKALMYNLFKESKQTAEGNALFIDTLLIELFDSIERTITKSTRQTPKWVFQIKELLNNSTFINWTLQELAKELCIHPVHLSRDFTKYFNCTLGDYIRTIRLQQALILLSEENISLTAIAHTCGFADQSHFTRSFKSLYKINPLAYKKLLCNGMLILFYFASFVVDRFVNLTFVAGFG